ncbi:sensor histidine kinase [Candidatus Frankia alpina]|uniref:histidine kinase n=1 Tax=Candidatus Frankia alpina TaxID=2699483 RepID=A0A4S5ERJ0_9ACTN|nr:ATP-binding protein [Candidatus Frankia alpina]THJ74640.1 ATP-binding protein [Candidatus Frankia alpina]
MTTRARELFQRSRALLENSREVAAQLLASRGVHSRPAVPPAAAPPSPPARDHAGSPTQPAVPPTALPGTSVVQPTNAAPPTATPATTTTQALSAICADVALRDLNLVDGLLSQLEEMEAREGDAERLAELYQLDHLAARLRRNAENLRILAGRDASETASETAALVDVIRAAMSSIDHYSRVTIGRVVPLGIVRFAAEDVGRLLAELLDNATKSSPPTTPVRVGVHLTEQGSALLRVEDEGIGLPPERMRRLNDRLRASPTLDDDAVRHMGLAVVGRIAARHEIRTWLDRRHPHGTTASALLPAALICELPEPSWSGAQTVTAAPAAAVRTLGSSAHVVAPAGLPQRRAAHLARPRPAAPAAHSARPASAAPVLRPVPSPPPTSGSGLGLGPAAGEATASGLPRRVSRSLKNGTGPLAAPLPPAPSAAAAAGREADHERLLADLGAFTEGERAARDEQRGA